MSIKMSQIVAAVESGALKKIEEGFPPWRYRLTCARFVDAIRSEYRHYDQARIEAVKKYGVENKEKPGVIEVSPENRPAFGDAMLELLETDVELSVEALEGDKLGPELQKTLTVADLSALAPFLIAVG